jgi:DNA-binding YbaB/EbfC family protein
MAKIQEEIKAMEFVSSSGGGLVSLTMSGGYDIKNIQIDDSLLNVEEKTMLADLIIAAYNDARRKVQESSEDKMKSLTEGLPLPPGFKIPGMF